MHDALFTPLTVGSIKAPNRIFMAPLTRSRAAMPGNIGSFVRQYPPTPKPGWRMLLCVGRMRIASITEYKSTLIASENRAHSSMNAMFVARKLFSITLASSDAVVFARRVSGYSAVLITRHKNASQASAAASE